MDPRVVIVGGGIGGMALAAALSRRGRPPALLLEQTPELGEVGSGLGVLPSAVHALRSLGVSDDLFGPDNAAPLRRMRICSHRGRDLSDLDLREVFAQVGAPGYVMFRTGLHAALMACVDPALLRTGARVRAIRSTADGVEIDVEGDPTPVQADILVGADGLRSVVRAHLLGDTPPRYAGETIFRGISELQLDPPDSREVFGPGRRIGLYPIGGGKTYFWATSPEPQGTRIAPGDRRAFLQRAFADWPFDIPKLIDLTPEERILQNDIFDRPPAPRWHAGPIVLLGDAAHPTTPNMGQGACMAIEDAVALGRHLCEHEDLETALHAYTAERTGRTARITRLSRLWGEVGLWRSPLATWLRDGFFRITPDAIFRRTLVGQYTYRP